MIKTDAQLGTIFREAMKIWDGQKADGVPLLERVAGLSRTLRACWPQTREWKYLCSSCSDYGLVMAECPGVTDATCGRVNAHPPHEFGRPCWCEAGRKFRPKRVADEAIDAAATVRKPSRVGR